MRYAPPLILMLTVLGGCTVGPNYEHPPATAGATAPWVEPGARPGAVDQSWWRALGDPMLDRLVDSALTGNLDIREAQARLLEARANRDAAAGRAAPEIRATASASENQLSGNGQIPVARIPGFTRQFSLFDAGFDASWEIDLWGGTRRAVEGSRARAAAAAARIDDIRLQSIAEVARSYTDLRASQARLANARADSAVRESIASLVEQRATAGEASVSDLAGARQRADTARAAISGIEADIRGAIYRLALLTGKPPEALLAELSPAASLPQAPALVATGIRSDLLRRRADIRAADADLAAATADIGAETANLYPHISLTGSLGQQSRTIGNIGSGASTRFQIGPSFSWPIFSFGRIRAQVRAADARADAAAARYEKAVLAALADSETAINRLAAARTAQLDRNAALDQSSTAAALAERRFRAGEDDRIAWLEAQSTRLAIEQQALIAQTDSLKAYIALAKALGGTWAETDK
ncbi:efflux transporter outer membrane subunit [Sphingomonas sp. 28-63-12]|uniref:efflux transporter outer membrane subunit n=1 Tax=Sphingomonas sp. 28-63-12 TaxID=1970434 RepID=UPI000BC7056C|nr:MAG: RND transporter [Sphingomonas sp. 28-63-12]